MFSAWRHFVVAADARVSLTSRQRRGYSMLLTSGQILYRRLRPMHFGVKQSARTLLACSLISIFAVQPSVVAQSHVVSPTELQKQAVSATQTREQNIEKVQRLLSSKQGEQAIKAVRANPEQVKAAVSRLDDAELARLAARADKAQADFAAGNLSDRDLIIILLAIVALILIIVAVR